MQNKRLISCVICFILLLTFIFLNPLLKPSISTFKTYVMDDTKISSSLMENYLSKDEKVSLDSGKKIVHITLKNLNYIKWLSYEEYIQLKIYKQRVIPNEDNLLVVMNLSKDVAVIGIYTKVDDVYVYNSKIENILPVIKLSFKDYPDKNYKNILIYEKLDERLGAFYYEEFLEIWGYDSNTFKKSFKNLLYSEEIYNLNWIDKSLSKDRWSKNKKRCIIDFISSKKIETNTTIKTYESISKKFPTTDSFKFIKEETLKDSFSWDKNSLKYISDSKKSIPTFKEIIIYDMNHYSNSENHKIVNNK